MNSLPNHFSANLLGQLLVKSIEIKDKYFQISIHMMLSLIKKNILVFKLVQLNYLILPQLLVL